MEGFNIIRDFFRFFTRIKKNLEFQDFIDYYEFKQDSYFERKFIDFKEFYFWIKVFDIEKQIVKILQVYVIGLCKDQSTNFDALLQLFDIYKKSCRKDIILQVYDAYYFGDNQFFIIEYEDHSLDIQSYFDRSQFKKNKLDQLKKILITYFNQFTHKESIKLAKEIDEIDIFDKNLFFVKLGDNEEVKIKLNILNLSYFQPIPLKDQDSWLKNQIRFKKSIKYDSINASKSKKQTTEIQDRIMNAKEVDRILIEKDELVKNIKEDYPKLLQFHDQKIFEHLIQSSNYLMFEVSDFDEDYFILNTVKDSINITLLAERFESKTQSEEIITQYNKLFSNNLADLQKCDLLKTESCNYIIIEKQIKQDTEKQQFSILEQLQNQSDNKQEFNIGYIEEEFNDEQIQPQTDFEQINNIVKVSQLLYSKDLKITSINPQKLYFSLNNSNSQSDILIEDLFLSTKQVTKVKKSNKFCYQKQYEQIFQYLLLQNLKYFNQTHYEEIQLDIRNKLKERFKNFKNYALKEFYTLLKGYLTSIGQSSKQDIEQEIIKMNSIFDKFGELKDTRNQLNQLNHRLQMQFSNKSFDLYCLNYSVYPIFNTYIELSFYEKTINCKRIIEYILSLQLEEFYLDPYDLLFFLRHQILDEIINTSELYIIFDQLWKHLSQNQQIYDCLQLMNKVEEYIKEYDLLSRLDDSLFGFKINTEQKQNFIDKMSVVFIDTYSQQQKQQLQDQNLFEWSGQKQFHYSEDSLKYQSCCLFNKGNISSLLKLEQRLYSEISIFMISLLIGNISQSKCLKEQLNQFQIYLCQNQLQLQKMNIYLMYCQPVIEQLKNSEDYFKIKNKSQLYKLRIQMEDEFKFENIYYLIYKQIKRNNHHISNINFKIHPVIEINNLKYIYKLPRLVKTNQRLLNGYYMQGMVI